MPTPSSQRLKIGISACFLHPDPERSAYAVKTLQYLEQSTAHWVMSAGAMPVFGICRGLQLINVAFGGTLYQDLSTQREGALAHRDAHAFDDHFHALSVVPNTRLSALLVGVSSYKINSIHHQGIKSLAPGFVAEAHCPDDGVIEAIRHTGDAWVAGVQWHPEFHQGKPGVVNDGVLLQDFLSAATLARARPHPVTSDHLSPDK